MTQGEKEIADLVDKYLKTIAKLAGNYEKAIGSLDRARENYKTKTKYYPLIAFIVVVIGLIVLNYFIKWSKIDLPDGITITHQP